MAGLSGYQEAISKVTGVTDPVELQEIEDWMRDVIFHSTLDWQPRAQFNRGARDAKALLDDMKAEVTG